VTFSRIGVLLLLAATACAHGVSSRFSTSRSSDEALELIRGGFEDAGFQVSDVDRRQGTVTTQWRDTGRLSSRLMPGQVPATVFVRYTATWVPSSSRRHEVRISGEAQRCAPGAYVGPGEVTGVCDEQGVDSKERQAAADALARRLARTLLAPPEEGRATATATAER
jgi:hypothetical protein